MHVSSAAENERLDYFASRYSSNAYCQQF